jgi:hypothetical protein
VLHLVTTSIDARIRRAIAEKRLIEIGYKGRLRVAEPHDYGCINGVDRLLIYQLRSKGDLSRDSRGWRMMDLSKIESLTLLDTTFAGSRTQAQQSHYSWDAIYARVE